MQTVSREKGEEITVCAVDWAKETHTLCGQIIHSSAVWNENPISCQRCLKKVEEALTIQFVADPTSEE